MATKRKKADRELVNQSQFARISGVNRSTINRQVRDGIIPTHGPKKLIDVDEATLALGKNLDPAMGGKRGAAAEADNGKNRVRIQVLQMRKQFEEARRVGQILKNQLLEVEIDRLNQQYISREAAELASKALSDAALRAWESWPDRASGAIAEELDVDVDKLHSVLSRYVKENVDLCRSIAFQLPKGGDR